MTPPYGGRRGTGRTPNGRPYGVQRGMGGRSVIAPTGAGIVVGAEVEWEREGQDPPFPELLCLLGVKLAGSDAGRVIGEKEIGQCAGDTQLQVVDTGADEVG